MSKDKDIIDKSIDELQEEDLDYLARFTCLMYGVNVAADAAERLGLDTEKDSSWIKPIFFQKYIDERFEDMKYNIDKSLKGQEDEVYSW